jgi:hypothetical protein
MPQNPAPTNRPEQFPPVTALTSMFPIHIGPEAPASAQTPKAPGRNIDRAPVRHDPK